MGHLQIVHRARGSSRPDVFERVGPKEGNGTHRRSDIRVRDMVRPGDEPRGPWYAIHGATGEVLCTVPLRVLPRSFPRSVTEVPKPVREFARLLRLASCRCGHCYRNGCQGLNGRVTVITTLAEAQEHCISAARFQNGFWMVENFRSMCWSRRISDTFGVTY